MIQDIYLDILNILTSYEYTTFDIFSISIFVIHGLLLLVSDLTLNYYNHKPILTDKDIFIGNTTHTFSQLITLSFAISGFWIFLGYLFPYFAERYLINHQYIM